MKVYVVVANEEHVFVAERIAEPVAEGFTTFERRGNAVNLSFPTVNIARIEHD